MSSGAPHASAEFSFATLFEMLCSALCADQCVSTFLVGCAVMGISTFRNLCAVVGIWTFLSLVLTSMHLNFVRTSVCFDFFVRNSITCIHEC